MADGHAAVDALCQTFGLSAREVSAVRGEARSLDGEDGSTIEFDTIDGTRKFRLRDGTEL